MVLKKNDEGRDRRRMSETGQKWEADRMIWVFLEVRTNKARAAEKQWILHIPQGYRRHRCRNHSSLHLNTLFYHKAFWLLKIYLLAGIARMSWCIFCFNVMFVYFFVCLQQILNCLTACCAVIYVFIPDRSVTLSISISVSIFMVQTEIFSPDICDPHWMNLIDFWGDSWLLALLSQNVFINAE